MYEELEMLIRRYRELGFINEIRESLLYFPTYRRIDADIKNLLDSSFQRSGSYAMREWSNAFNNNIHDFSRDRRVIVVGDEDIEKIYNVYSDELRQFNSEGLNELLKEFIKKVITSLYEDNTSHNMMNTKRNSNKKKNVYQTDPKHLLELAEKLGLDNINKEKVTQYYENKREFQKIYHLS